MKLLLNNDSDDSDSSSDSDDSMDDSDDSDIQVKIAELFKTLKSIAECYVQTTFPNYCLVT